VGFGPLNSTARLWNRQQSAVAGKKAVGGSARVFQGGLRSSILATLEHDQLDGASEAKLARLCGVTRKAIHEALDHLELCDLVQRRRFGRELQASLKAHVLRQAS
jgi:hypothetical protein